MWVDPIDLLIFTGKFLIIFLLCCWFNNLIRTGLFLQVDIGMGKRASTQVYLGSSLPMSQVRQDHIKLLVYTKEKN